MHAHRRPQSIRTTLLAATIGIAVLTASCSGSQNRAERREEVQENPVATPGTNGEPGADTTIGDTAVGAPAAGNDKVSAAIFSGEPTRFADGAFDEMPWAPPLDRSALSGRDCGVVPPRLGSCRTATGAGGTFIVTTESHEEIFSTWDVVIRCGLDPAVPIASADQIGLTASADLTFEPYGEVTGVELWSDVGSEAALVYQPTGASCPQVFGLGPVEQYSIMGGGLDIVSITRPDGSIACVVADAAQGFAVSAATGTTCPN